MLVEVAYDTHCRPARAQQYLVLAALDLLATVMMIVQAAEDFHIK